MLQLSEFLHGLVQYLPAAKAAAKKATSDEHKIDPLDPLDDKARSVRRVSSFGPDKVSVQMKFKPFVLPEVLTPESIQVGRWARPVTDSHGH